MGNCAAKKKTIVTTDTSQTPGQWTSQIRVKRKTGLFEVAKCPVDNQLIENMQKSLNSFSPFVFGLKGDLIQEWIPVRFEDKPQKNEWWYFGEWKENEMHGKGAIYNGLHEFLISGLFNRGLLFKSQCRKILKNGSCYTGPLNDNYEAHGIGQIFQQDKYSYKGNFINGIFDGTGLFTCPNYEFNGFFDDGFKTKGILITSSEKYEGEFKNNFKEGEGVQEYHNGDKYVGKFERNKRNGFGKVLNAEGTILQKGMWKSNKLISQ